MDENDIENGGYNQLQELIVKNSQNNNKQVSYIVNSKIKDVIHFFYWNNKDVIHFFYWNNRVKLLLLKI